MKEEPLQVLHRREFLSSASLLVTGCCLTGFSPLWASPLQTVPSLPDELSASELEAVKKSSMAGELEDYFGKGYSCAESLLMVGLRHLPLFEELVWVAAGFGGGMQHKETCGFLTAGIMDLGLAAGRLKLERPEAKEWSKQRVDAYWSWWTIQAPIRCADIRKEGTSSKVCRRLGLLAAAKVEELITSFEVPDERPRIPSLSSRTSGRRSG
ncbi:MAG: C-GCAxxG-C-C family protein [Candidatus Aminicenantales bacterium]